MLVSNVLRHKSRVPLRVTLTLGQRGVAAAAGEESMTKEVENKQSVGAATRSAFDLYSCNEFDKRLVGAAAM